MSTIFTEDFLLQNESARKLYHWYAKDLPIIDYHNHLPPTEIAEDKKYENLTELWLKGDHYKWRAMRTLGISEHYITGAASDEEKFLSWASCVPHTLRNPLFHWTHLELKNPFGIQEYLNTETASKAYHTANEFLKTDAFSTRGLLNNYKVEMLCTTDDPCDHLAHHEKIQDEGFEVKVQPGFRPDKALQIHKSKEFKKYIQELSIVSKIEIHDFDTLLKALKSRLNYFHDKGCRISDHGLTTIPVYQPFTKELQNELKLFLQNEQAIFSNPECFTVNLLLELCKMYHEKEWVQQFHLGPIRNNNFKLFNQIGADAGVDSIGDYSQAEGLSTFLNELDKTDKLAKTIIYNINPADNEVFATMVGNFNDGSIKAKVQYGSGWWFLDQLDGMEKQLNALSNMGLVSTFVGMLTDSRSFLSFPRHEYFRRLICNLFGTEMEKGLLPNDEKWIGEMIANICYHNAKEYFKLV
ncbi:MAG: glucuronate isomerase [Chitinophagaceae bacterium]|nr:MAG: glucuronate isomerase [Chitinophagaceae bacterium]